MPAECYSLLVAVATAIVTAALGPRLAFYVFDLVGRGRVSVAALGFLSLSHLNRP